MGWLAIFIYLAITIWFWTSFGVLAGIAAAVIGFFPLNFIGPRLDARYGDRSLQKLEFHAAWDELVGPPQTPEELAAKSRARSDWRVEWKTNKVSAYDWINERVID